jgi:hypothetical protein
MRRFERLAVAVTVAAAIAGLLMIATEFSTVTSIEVISGGESCATQLVNPHQRDRCELTGFERHYGALALLGLLALLMGWGAGMGGSRPAAGALIAIGVLVLALALLRDLPESTKTGAVGPLFENARATRGTGLYLELVGGALAVCAGALRLSARSPEDRRPAR